MSIIHCKVSKYNHHLSLYRMKLDESHNDEAESCNGKSLDDITEYDSYGVDDSEPLMRLSI